MTAYIFETITDAQAAAFQAGDTLTRENIMKQAASLMRDAASQSA